MINVWLSLNSLDVLLRHAGHFLDAGRALHRDIARLGQVHLLFVALQINLNVFLYEKQKGFVKNCL